MRSQVPVCFGCAYKNALCGEYIALHIQSKSTKTYFLGGEFFFNIKSSYSSCHLVQLIIGRVGGQVRGWISGTWWWLDEPGKINLLQGINQKFIPALSVFFALPRSRGAKCLVGLCLHSVCGFITWLTSFADCSQITVSVYTADTVCVCCPGQPNIEHTQTPLNYRHLL